MLLSSPAFTGFLQELNHSGVPESSRQPARQERPQSSRKDVNPHEAARQLHSQQPQIGMALVPEPNIDLSLFDTPSWNAVPSSDFHVFAVTELPQGPAVNLERCSGKSEKPALLSSETTKMVPSLPEVPQQVKASESEVKAKIAPSSPPSAPTATLYRQNSALISTLNPKPTFELRQANVDAVVSGSWDQLKALCSELDAAAERLAGIIPGIE